jgi:membrane protein DedA with SNARE-associated domain
MGSPVSFASLFRAALPGLLIVGVAGLIGLAGAKATIVPVIVAGFLIAYIGMIVLYSRQRRRQKAEADSAARAQALAAAQKKQEVEDILGKYARK